MVYNRLMVRYHELQARRCESMAESPGVNRSMLLDGARSHIDAAARHSLRGRDDAKSTELGTKSIDLGIRIELAKDFRRIAREFSSPQPQPLQSGVHYSPLDDI